MLFMAVQDYHEARLPSGLQDVYVQYKQDTRAIIAWLVSHGPSRYKASQRLSIKDLRKLADYIRTKAVEMPDVIGFQFRQAIAARSRLSKVFRSGIDQSQRFTRTEDHEFFTNSLQKMYADLCECCARPKDACVHQNCDHTSVADLNNCRYSALVADCVDEDEDDREILPESEDSRQPAEACAESARPVDLNCSPIIAEDHLGVAFEACQLVNELVTLLNKIHSIWDEAARGELSVVAAAVLSSAAYTACGDIENRLALSCQIIDPAELHRICNQANEAFHASMSPDESSLLSNNLTTGLDDCWQNLLKLKYHSLKNGFEQDILTNQGSFSITLANGGTSAAIDCECRKVLLRNIVHCLTDKRQINNVIRLGTPVYAEVGFMLTHTNEQSQSLHGSLGLHMLLESYKTYAFKIAPKPASLCRLQALKFAQAALPSIDAVLDSPTMPCRCHGTLAYHLENVKLDFTYYLKLKQFDLFFQSPWVCGSHIVEMLHILHYYGLRLFAYRRYVGSVIHMYNALRQMTDFEPIEVLEDMSATFSDLFFPGGRPTRNFKVGYLRYLGGRLHFHSKKSVHKTGCHELIIPPHTAKATAGFTDREDARFDTGRLCFLFRLKERGWNLSDKSVAQMMTSPTTSHMERKIAGLSIPATSPSSSRPTSRESSRPSSSDGSLSPNPSSTSSAPGSDTCSPLDHVSTLITPALSGQFPLARINMFKFYNLCANIVDKVSDRYHGPETRPGQYCLCCAEVLLESADEVSQGGVGGVRKAGGRYNGLSKDVKELIMILREVIGEGMGGVGREDVLWSGVV